MSVRFRHQTAAVRPSSQVRGQTGPSGAFGEEIQGSMSGLNIHDEFVKDSDFKCVLKQVNNMLDDTHPPRDFHGVVKPAIEDMMGREVTFDILFHNSEHQATLFRYGVKKSEQVSQGKSATFCLFAVKHA